MSFQKDINEDQMNMNNNHHSSNPQFMNASSMYSNIGGNISSNSMSFMSMPSLSFKPASNSASALNELIDLNDIFADEFYIPSSTFEEPGLYISDSDQLLHLASDPTTAASGRFNMHPGYQQQQFQQLPYVNGDNNNNFTRNVNNNNNINLNNTNNVLRKNDVIMSPPTVPRRNIGAPISSAGSRAGVIKAEPDDDGRRRDKRERSFDDASIEDRGGKQQKTASSSSSRVAAETGVDYQRIERRERNREHAKRSRVRKKLLLDSLQDQLAALRHENVKLRRVVAERIPQHALRILSECTTEESSLLASMHAEDEKINNNNNNNKVNVVKPSPLTTNIAPAAVLSLSNNNNNNNNNNNSSNSGGQQSNNNNNNHLPPGSAGRPLKQTARVLMEPDYRLIQSLVTSQQNFVLSDPSLPDNPIVYVSEGFLRMTGYKRQEVLGRNCRFLQGPGTDQAAVDIIRQGVRDGRDISVCLLNYKADGRPFWNQFFLAALKDADGQIVNYVGVQCEVNSVPVTEIKDRVKKLPIPTEM